MFCRNCGSEMEDAAKFCPKCGAKVEQEEPVTVQPEPENLRPQEVYQPEVQPQEAAPETPKEKKSIVLPVVLSILVVLIAGVMGFGIYSAVRTRDFKKEIAQYEQEAQSYASLGKFESDYTELLDTSRSAASHLNFWKYEDLKQQMSDLEQKVEEMNAAVAEYREDYEQIVQTVEGDAVYIMDDYGTDYETVKAELENALQEFDERTCKSSSEKLQEICDNIVSSNEQKAKEYLEKTQNIKSSFSGYSVEPFEQYMIGDLTATIEGDKDTKDYVKLQDDFAQLDDWAQKFTAVANTEEQIGKFVQADVSSPTEVKLYLNAYDYDSYNFQLEDFEIYEKYNGQWQQCPAQGMSQIAGTLSMDIVADISGSMRYNFYEMQDSIDTFVNQTHSDTVLGLSTIGTIYERYQDFTTDKDAVTNAVWNLDCYGLTSLYQSLYSSVVYTASAEGARCVVAFTDGINEPYGAGYDYDAQDVIDVATYYQVPVYIIGIGSYVQEDELRDIANATGGAFYANCSVYDLRNIYMDIYETQGRMYQLTYKTSVPNNVNRDIYVLYADDTQNLGIRFEEELNAEALQSAYASAGISAGDPASFYTTSKYLSSDDLAKLGDDLEAVQTVINIYFAKNGYSFGSSENGQKQLAKMISLGVITENGTLDGDTVTAILHNDPILWQNFSALYNYRYEIVFTTTYDIYCSNPEISYEDARRLVAQHYGEENETRFHAVIQAAWKNIQAGNL